MQVHMEEITRNAEQEIELKLSSANMPSLHLVTEIFCIQVCTSASRNIPKKAHLYVYHYASTIAIITRQLSAV